MHCQGHSDHETCYQYYLLCYVILHRLAAHVFEVAKSCSIGKEVSLLGGIAVFSRPTHGTGLFFLEVLCVLFETCNVKVHKKLRAFGLTDATAQISFFAWCTRGVTKSGPSSRVTPCSFGQTRRVS